MAIALQHVHFETDRLVEQGVAHLDPRRIAVAAQLACADAGQRLVDIEPVRRQYFLGACRRHPGLAQCAVEADRTQGVDVGQLQVARGFGDGRYRCLGLFAIGERQCRCPAGHRDQRAAGVLLFVVAEGLIFGDRGGNKTTAHGDGKGQLATNFGVEFGQHRLEFRVQRSFGVRCG